jgi:general stress protein YciG
MADHSKRGFASMDADRQREIATKGGRVAHEKGTAHEFTPAEAREAGRKGGMAISRDHQHMSAIGHKGGEAVSRDREHMATIGRKGGEVRGMKAGLETAANPCEQSPEARHRSMMGRPEPPPAGDS